MSWLPITGSKQVKQISVVNNYSEKKLYWTKVYSTSTNDAKNIIALLNKMKKFESKRAYTRAVNECVANSGSLSDCTQQKIKANQDLWKQFANDWGLFRHTNSLEKLQHDFVVLYMVNLEVIEKMEEMLEEAVQKVDPTFTKNSLKKSDDAAFASQRYLTSFLTDVFLSHPEILVEFLNAERSMVDYARKNIFKVEVLDAGSMTNYVDDYSEMFYVSLFKKFPFTKILTIAGSKEQQELSVHSLDDFLQLYPTFADTFMNRLEEVYQPIGPLIGKLVLDFCYLQEKVSTAAVTSTDANLTGEGTRWVGLNLFLLG